jgi:hypothetical protein
MLQCCTIGIGAQEGRGSFVKETLTETFEILGKEICGCTVTHETEKITVEALSEVYLTFKCRLSVEA